MPVLTLLLKDKKLAFDFETGVSALSVLNTAAINISSACAGHGFCGLCRIKILNGEVSELTAVEQNRLSAPQIQQSTRLACQVKALADVTVAIQNPLNVLKWKKLHPLHKSALNAQAQYGIAVDLGTTHLRLSLWNITQQQRILAWSTFNPQFRFGSDVLTRLMAAQNSDTDALELSLLIKQTLKNAIRLIEKLPLSMAQIRQLLIVGNSPMLVLLSHKNFQLLLEPEYWTQAVDTQIENVSDWQTFLGLGSQTAIANVPALAGFVGSDLLAGILATDLINRSEPALLIDFGTNSELALWDGEKLWISSVPGGPAFEGSGISCGMPAEAGAVCRMTTKDDGYWDYQLIGNSKALGLCGSALVDVIAQLLAGGQLNRNGRFKNMVNNEVLLPLSSEFALALKKQDVDIFQRAKAATGAAQLQLFKESGLALADLAHVYVCGAFGRFLDVKHAQAIGLLPSCPVEKVKLYENAALSGCELLLSSSEQTLETLAQIRARTQIVNMAHALDFDEVFVNNLYLQPLVFEK